MLSLYGYLFLVVNFLLRAEVCPILKFNCQFMMYMHVDCEAFKLCVDLIAAEFFLNEIDTSYVSFSAISQVWNPTVEVC